MRDDKQTVKIELLSQCIWMLEAEFRKNPLTHRESTGNALKTKRADSSQITYATLLTHVSVSE